MTEAITTDGRVGVATSTDAAARTDYVRGVNLLKAEATGMTTGQVGVPGPGRGLSTYDLFVLWHHRDGRDDAADPGRSQRGPSRPVFLPWHRFMLIFLEAQLQRVLEQPDLRPALLGLGGGRRVHARSRSAWRRSGPRTAWAWATRSTAARSP